MDKPSISDCLQIELSQTVFGNGRITCTENNSSFPFEVKRIFYIYDIPADIIRGAHAHKKCHQLFVAASGSFTVSISDGHNKVEVKLDRPNCGLHIPPGIWAEELTFSPGSICLVLTSDLYNSNDYIRDYSDFLYFRNDRSL